MYNAFYGFRESPFNITPDPRFLFFSDQHREAFNHVLFGIRERKGFIQLTGEVGAGKTTVCRAILTELGEKCRRADKTAYLEQLNAYLLAQMPAGNDVVLFIDEAQDLDA